MKAQNMYKALTAAVLASALLAGCSGGGSKVASSVPAAPSNPGNNTQQMGGITFKVMLPPGTYGQSGQRSPQYIPPTALSILASISPLGGSTGAGFYANSSSCVNIVPGVFTYNITLPAPIGLDNLTIATYNTACATVGVGGAEPSSGVALSSNGPNTIIVPQATAGGAPASFGGFVLGQLTNPAGSSISGGSLSSATAGLSTFAIDTTALTAANYEGLPFGLVIKDNAGNTLTSPDSNGTAVTLQTSIKVKLTDTSSIGLAGGTLALAAIDTATGGLYTLTGCGAAALTLGALGAGAVCPTVVSGTTASLTVTLTNAPPAGLQFVVLFGNGNSSRNKFQTGTLAVTQGSAQIGSTINLSSQSVITTPALPVPPAVAGALTGVFNIATTTTTALQEISDGNVVYEQAPGGALGAGSTANVGSTFTGLSTIANTDLYAADPACGVTVPMCSSVPASTGSGKVGVAHWVANGTVNANAPVAVAVSATSSTVGYITTITAPYPVGPIGVLAETAAQCAAGTTCGTFGNLWLVANNSLYQLQMATNVASMAGTAGNPNCVAGSCTAGPTGEGNATGSGNTSGGPTGTARFNFGSYNFSGTAGSGTFAGGVLTVMKDVLFVDPVNNSVRDYNIAGNSVTTYAQFTAPPAGISIDPFSKILFVAVPTQNAIYQVTGSGATPLVYGGTVGTAGTASGLAKQAYPLQFNAGNAVAASTSTGVTVATAFGSIATLPVNTNQAAQKAAGVAAYVGTLNGPSGVAVDAVTAGNPIYITDFGANLLRQAL